MTALVLATLGGALTGYVIIAGLIALAIARAIRIADVRDGCRGMSDAPARSGGAR